MGGHSAWRKRVANGELAKQYSGAISRHRPHLGRKGKDLIKNRKGHIAGGNPKKQKNNRSVALSEEGGSEETIAKEQPIRNTPLMVLGATWILVLFALLVYLGFGRNR
jgi:hypothetical protein